MRVYIQVDSFVTNAVETAALCSSSSAALTIDTLRARQNRVL